MRPAMTGAVRLRRRTALGLLAGALAAPAAIAAPRAGFGAALDRARALGRVRCLVVAHRGKIVLAEALRGPGLEAPANVKSVSKTVVAALTGAAIDRGLVAEPERRLAEVAPGLVPRGADARVEEITLGHLLTMQAGLERTSGANYGAWVQSANWVRDALSRPFVAEPGGRMLYSTGSYHVLGAALSEAAGRSLLALSRDWLGDPLGLEIRPWTRDPQGRFMGGNNMAVSPLGLLRLGETFRQGGVFDGARVLGEGWVRESWRPRTVSPWSGDSYGYSWFLRDMVGRRAAFARGYGGQMLWVIPVAELTAAVTSDPTRPARSDGYAGALHALVAETILPAAEAAG